MKANYHKLKDPIEQAFHIRKDVRPYFDDKWHFHDMLELVCIVQGNGERYIGDSIASFKDGEVVLLGSKLPHVWKSENPEHLENNIGIKKCIAIVIQFPATFLGEHFLSLEEAKDIKVLMSKAKRGVVFKGQKKKLLGKLINELLEYKGMGRIIKFLEILQIAASSKKYSLLASPMFMDSVNYTDDKINKVFGYVMNNFKEDIQLIDVAEFIGMNKTAFCRYFKKRTKKTFSNFLNEVRIGHACKLIREDDLSITEAAYLSGYNSPSYFYKKFKVIRGNSPTEYKSMVV